MALLPEPGLPSPGIHSFGPPAPVPAISPPVPAPPLHDALSHYVNMLQGLHGLLSTGAMHNNPALAALLAHVLGQEPTQAVAMNALGAHDDAAQLWLSHHPAAQAGRAGHVPGFVQHYLAQQARHAPTGLPTVPTPHINPGLSLL